VDIYKSFDFNENNLTGIMMVPELKLIKQKIKGRRK